MSMVYFYTEKQNVVMNDVNIFFFSDLIWMIYRARVVQNTAMGQNLIPETDSRIFAFCSQEKVNAVVYIPQYVKIRLRHHWKVWTSLTYRFNTEKLDFLT